LPVGPPATAEVYKLPAQGRLGVILQEPRCCPGAPSKRTSGSWRSRRRPAALGTAVSIPASYRSGLPTASPWCAFAVGGELLLLDESFGSVLGHYQPFVSLDAVLAERPRTEPGVLVSQRSITTLLVDPQPRSDSCPALVRRAPRLRPMLSTSSRCMSTPELRVWRVDTTCAQPA
jgi:hypothetical protein